MLSPESVSLPATSTPIEKRQRHNSKKACDINPLNLNKMETEPQDLQSWMAMISSQLKLTATKLDIQQMNDAITAQGQEINQIKDELKLHKKDLDDLRNSFDQSQARRLNRMYNTTSTRGQANVNNMAEQNKNRPLNEHSTRKNLVVEGLKGESEDEMIASLLSITTSIGAIVYKTDIEEIFRLKRRDSTNLTPGPVLVRFNRIAIRDNVLKRKINLHGMADMKSVYINADEPVEVRHLKAIFRRVAYNAKQAGEVVELRHNHITISGITYILEELEKIPSHFRPDINAGIQAQATNAPRIEEADDIITDEVKRTPTNLD